jgi:signal transduction histidine kinase
LEKALAAQKKLQVQLDRTSQELKDFAYIISHDLKAPMRAIKILIDWISTDYAEKLDDEGKDQMKLLVNRVDRLHRLLEGVLEYSRIERIREPIVPINLNELVPDIIEAMAPPDHILVTIDSELPVIETEPLRIRQVFEHLISNAIRFMDKAQGFVKIQSSEDGDSWTFSITDNGPGIPEQHHEKIFKIFQTLAAKDQCETTGVGLTLVKKIVELYGGRVWVESTLGQGSTFHFTWPKHLIEEAAMVEAAV